MKIDTKKYSHVEVSGDAIFPLIKKLGADANALCKSLMAKFKLEGVEKGQYYPLESWLGLVHNIEEKMPSVLKEMGKYIFAEAVFPETMNFEQVLMMTHQAYYMNHRGCQEGEIGYYKCKKESDKEYIMEVVNPYPCLFNMGLFLGYADYFKQKISIEHADTLCFSKGDEICNYRIKITE